MTLTEDVIPAEIRLMRGVPTRISSGGTTYLLGIHGVAPDESSATIGVHVNGTGATTGRRVNDPVLVGTVTYDVTHISRRKVTLCRRDPS